MKKKGFVLLGILSIALSSCYFTINPQPTSKNSDYSSFNSESSLNSELPSSEPSSSKPISSSTPISSSNVIPSSNPISSSQSLSSSTGPVLKTKTFSTTQLQSVSTQYSTGNYGNLTINGTMCRFYRALGGSPGPESTQYGVKLLDCNYDYLDHGYPGCFYNSVYSPLYGIKNISVTYKATNGLDIYYYLTAGSEQKYMFGPTTVFKTESFDVASEANFFRVATHESDAFIREIVITYTGEEGSGFNTYTLYDGYRREPSKYTGDLVSGSSYMNMYISPSDTKKYTYYSKDYCYSNYNTIDKEDAFLTSPVDICNYYLAFHEFPANFVTSEEKYTYGEKFGEYARQVSTYTRTDGYALTFSYNNQPGNTRPLYFELDVDLNGSYSLSSRGVGRVVIWAYGFSNYSEPSEQIPVCTYTDDHYNTFFEYDNSGGFSPRFDGEMEVTNYLYTPLHTI